MNEENLQAADSAPQAESMTESDFDQLLKKSFKSKTESKTDAIKTSVKSLCQTALENTTLVSDDAVATIEAMIAELDSKLTAQVNKILHHEDFQKLEGSWRGLHHLVNNTETDEMLKIRVMNISKQDLGKTLKKFKGTKWDQSPIFKKIYEEEYGTPGGQPYGCLVGDYYFNHSAPDCEMLTQLSMVASAAHAPFVSAADPDLMGFESWQDLNGPTSLEKIFGTAEYAPWRSLRDSEDAKYLALTAPRTLARLPYSPENNPVDEFEFVEDTEGEKHTNFTWQNAAYAMATNINASFKEYGWCSNIRGVEFGGQVAGLPNHTFPTDDGGVDAKCPTEIAITDRREKELSDLGIIGLCHYKNTDFACFYSGQSLQKPAEYDDPDATASANLSARLPYLFASSRFAHYLKCIVRDKVGGFTERSQLERFLQDWINNYIDGNPETSSPETKARKPLAEAGVTVEDVEGNPGFYTAKFQLKPHYQLEGMEVSMSLVSKLRGAS